MSSIFKFHSFAILKSYLRRHLTMMCPIGDDQCKYIYYAFYIATLYPFSKMLKYETVEKNVKVCYSKVKVCN